MPLYHLIDYSHKTKNKKTKTKKKNKKKNDQMLDKASYFKYFVYTTNVIKSKIT